MRTFLVIGEFFRENHIKLVDQPELVAYDNLATGDIVQMDDGNVYHITRDSRNKARLNSFDTWFAGQFPHAAAAIKRGRK